MFHTKNSKGKVAMQREMDRVLHPVVNPGLKIAMRRRWKRKMCPQGAARRMMVFIHLRKLRD